jgi:hypothetical protein
MHRGRGLADRAIPTHQPVPVSSAAVVPLAPVPLPLPRGGGSPRSVRMLLVHYPKRSAFGCGRYRRRGCRGRREVAVVRDGVVVDLAGLAALAALCVAVDRPAVTADATTAAVTVAAAVPARRLPPFRRILRAVTVWCSGGCTAAAAACNGRRLP